MAVFKQVCARSVHEDDGTTLIELVVGMAIMVIFMTIFTGVVFMMTNTVNKVEAVTTSASQINTAFVKLDKLVRYADAVSTAGAGTNGDWYVELRSLDSTNVETCTQIRIDNGELQHRNFPAGTTPPVVWDPDKVTNLAGLITNGSAPSGSDDQPFSVPAALPVTPSSFQRLTITLTTAGERPGTATTRSQMTFTALNSSASNANTAQCQVGR